MYMYVQYGLVIKSSASVPNRDGDGGLIDHYILAIETVNSKVRINFVWEPAVKKAMHHLVFMRRNIQY